MKVILTISAIAAVLGIILAVHIYLATRPHINNVNARTRYMARIDLHQPIGRMDADSISAWLYRQKGVNHVVVNSQRAIALFTFMPAKNSANSIVRAFKASLPYGKAERFQPSAEMMKSGCPVMH